MPFIGTDRCRSLRLIIDSGLNGELMISRLGLLNVRSVSSFYCFIPREDTIDGRSLQSYPETSYHLRQYNQERRLQER
jgi:hypothetical protein